MDKGLIGRLRTVPRRKAAVGFAVAVVAATASYLVGTEIVEYISHKRSFERVDTAVKALADRKPPAVTHREWMFIVGWTYNAIHNCCATRYYIDNLEHFHAFSYEIGDRCREDIDLHTIDWIWDELEQFSRYGKSYSESWRPTDPERLKDAEYVEFLAFPADPASAR